MKVAVMVASLGFISVAQADNLPSRETTPATTSATSTKEAAATTASTTDQVLVGGTQTSNNQGLNNQHDHSHDEDMD